MHQSRLTIGYACSQFPAELVQALEAEAFGCEPTPSAVRYPAWIVSAFRNPGCVEYGMPLERLCCFCLLVHGIARVIIHGMVNEPLTVNGYGCSYRYSSAARKFVATAHA